ncbi:MAG: GAF domain-containing protein [bacterium]|nr:GAF domain-containing protein [bacterium]
MFTLADWLADPEDNGLWLAYRTLSVGIILSVIGLFAGIAILVIGVLVSLIARLLQKNPLSASLTIAAQRFTVSASGVAASALLFLLFRDNDNLVIRAALVLCGGLLAAHLVRMLWQAAFSYRVGNLPTELLLIVSSVALAQTYQEAGALPFSALMLLVAMQVFRYRQVNQTREALSQRTQEVSALDTDNNMLRDRSMEMARHLSLINQAVQEVMFNLDADDALRTACNTALQIANAPKAAIFTREMDGVDQVHLRHAVGLTEAHLRLYQQAAYLPVFPPPNEAFMTRFVADTHLLPSSDPLRTLADAGQFRSVVQVPLRSGTLPFGMLAVFYNQPHIIPKTDLELLETLAYQMAAAQDNATLLKALEQYAAEQAQLVHLSRISNASLQLETVVESVSQLLRQMMNVDRVRVGLVLSNQETIRFYEYDHHGHRQLRDMSIQGTPELSLIYRQSQPSPRIFYRVDGQMSPALAALQDEQEAMLALVPMLSSGQLVGVIALSAFDSRELSDGEWRLVEVATNQIATQIHNAQLYTLTEDALNRRLRQLSAIEQIAQQITSSLDLDLLIRNVLEAAITATQAEMAAIGLIMETGEFRVIGQEYVFGKWYKYDLVRHLAYGLMGQVVLSGQPVVVADNQADPNYFSEAAQGTYRSSLVVPLMRDDVVVGALNVESTQIDFFKEEQVDFINSLAGHAVIAIQNARLLHERQSQIETLTSLRELSLEVAGDYTENQVVETVLRTSLNVMNGDSAVLLRYHQDSRQFEVIEGQRRRDGAYVKAEVAVPADSAQWAAITGKVQVVEDAQVSERYLNHSSSSAVDYCSMIMAPIKRGNVVQEVLCVALLEQHVFTENDYNNIELLAIQAAGHLSNAALLARVRTGSTRMRAILDSTRDGIILLDTHGTLVDVNIAAERLLGVELEPYIGENFAATLMNGLQQGGLQEDTLQEALTDMARVLRLEPRRITTRSYEIRKANTVRFIDEVGSPVYDAHRANEIMGRLLTLRDVTEERALTAYRDEISSMVVHDLRAPLSTVISGVTLALDILNDIQDEVNKPVIEETLNASVDSATRLLQLVESMLEISKLETRRLPIKREPVILKDMFKNIFIAMSPALQENEITLELVSAEDLPPVSIDLDKMRRVLVNLLDNAIRYTPAQGVIHLSAERVDEKVLVHVSDSGRGIPAEERDRIFDKFTQVSGSTPLRGYKGIGLGLAFCKLVLEAHGERIWVADNCTLPGACFAFTLPLAVPEAVAAS